MPFEWDETKAQVNLSKHGVSFADAEAVFHAPLAAIFDDEWHSITEKREIIIGCDRANRLLLVCFTERAGTIRIISARLATSKERRDYEKTEISEPPHNDDLLPEYEFDYRKARPNRFATQTATVPLIVELEPDVAAMYPDAAAVNEALRFLIRIAKDSIAHS